MRFTWDLLVHRISIQLNAVTRNMCCCTLRPSVSGHLCTVAPGDSQGLRVSKD